MTRSIQLAVKLAAVVLAACLVSTCGSRKSENASRTQSGSNAPMTSPRTTTAQRSSSPKAAWVVKRLPKMRLTVLAPSGAKVEEYSGDVLGADVSLQTGFHVRLSTIKATRDSFEAEVKRQEQHRLYKFIKWHKKTKTPGGFHLHCEQKDKLGPINHTVMISATIGKQQIMCWQRTTEKKEIAGIVKACRSLKAAAP